MSRSSEDVTAPMRPHTTKYADVAEVEKKVETWSDAVLTCRTYGHHWSPSRATHYRRDRYFHVVQICPRCTSQRNFEMTEGGHVLASWIEYAEGYLSKGLGRIVGDGRDRLRIAAVVRTFDMQEESEQEKPARRRAAS